MVPRTRNGKRVVLDVRAVARRHGRRQHEANRAVGLDFEVRHVRDANVDTRARRNVAHLLTKDVTFVLFEHCRVLRLRQQNFFLTKTTKTAPQLTRSSFAARHGGVVLLTRRLLLLDFANEQLGLELGFEAANGRLRGRDIKKKYRFFLSS